VIGLELLDNLSHDKVVWSSDGQTASQVRVAINPDCAPDHIKDLRTSMRPCPVIHHPLSIHVITL